MDAGSKYDVRRCDPASSSKASASRSGNPNILTSAATAVLASSGLCFKSTRVISCSNPATANWSCRCSVTAGVVPPATENSANRVFRAFSMGRRMCFHGFVLGSKNRQPSFRRVCGLAQTFASWPVQSKTFIPFRNAVFQAENRTAGRSNVGCALHEPLHCDSPPRRVLR